jgi:hypothetical protein
MVRKSFLMRDIIPLAVLIFFCGDARYALCSINMPKTDDIVRDYQDQASPAPINTSSDVEFMIVVGPVSVGSSACLAHGAYFLQGTWLPM